MTTLYDQIGGAPAVNAAVDLFYEKVLADPRINHFFGDVDMAVQSAAQKNFLTRVMQGKAQDPERYMREAHSKLVSEKGLNEGHFGAVAEHLGATLDELNVPAELSGQIMTAVGGLRDSVLCR